jgi:hypothetical protein
MCTFSTIDLVWAARWAGSGLKVMLFVVSDLSLVLVDELAFVFVKSPFIESSFGDK